MMVMVDMLRSEGLPKKCDMERTVNKSQHNQADLRDLRQCLLQV